MRRNFTGSELAEGIRRQMAIESEKAKERMAEGGRVGNISTPSGAARDKAGEAFGISGKADPTPNSAEGCCSYGRYAKFGGARRNPRFCASCRQELVSAQT